MIDALKKFASRFTDRAIYKGTGVSFDVEIEQAAANAALPVVETNIDSVIKYESLGTGFVYSLDRINKDPETGAITYTLLNFSGNTSLNVSKETFERKFVRVQQPKPSTD